MDIVQENILIKGPKNKKQIGRIGKGDKIYIEDYAVTYLNQVARAPETQGGFAGLFGTCREVEGVKEYYIYAAVYQEAPDVPEKGLPRDAVQKIMRQRAEMFVEYFFLGWAIILREACGTMWESCYRSRLETLMGKPEILMTLRCNSCEEHFYLYPTEMPKETEGYFIFYEKNDAMQNFLIDWHGANHKDKCDEEGDNVAESCRNYYKEKRTERLRTRLAGVLLTAAALLLIFSAGVGVQSLNRYDKIQEAGQTLDDVIISDDIRASEESIGTENEWQEENILENDSDMELSENIVMNDSIMDSDELSADNNTILESTELNSENNLDAEMAEAILTDDLDMETSEIAIEEVSFEETIAEEVDVPENYITYEVSRGDTLYGICVRFYGNLSKAQEICRLNNIENMDNILYGEKILLPQ